MRKTMGRSPLIAAVMLFICCHSPEVAGGQVSRVKSDQQVLLFPSLAYPVDETHWEIQIRGSVFEPEQRSAVLFLLRTALALDRIHLSRAENSMLAERARLFMVDHEGGAKITVRIGDRVFDVGKSADNGFFSKTLRLSTAEIRKARILGEPVQVVLPAKDPRVFRGDVHYMKERALMVVSDIDDTIKITEVSDSRSILRNTFLKPFEPVPGMADVYQHWAGEGAQFFYVSASPWQLYSPLAAFIQSNSFPRGPFFLKDFRLKDKTFANLFQSPEKYKPAIIEALLKKFPERQFALVGDSGEKDPEIYGALARQYPKQIFRIFIRDLDSGTNHQARFESAFSGIPESTWKRFRDPKEIVDLLPAVEMSPTSGK